MHRIFRTFIDDISSASDLEAYRRAMAEAAAGFDLSCFAYLSMPPDPAGTPQLISNYPSNWTAHYLQCGYERFDPVIIRARAQPEPFEWGLSMGQKRAEKRQEELLEEAARFGIRYGFTVPIHDNDGPIAAMTFAADAREGQFKHSIKRHNRALQLLAMYFHANVRRDLGEERIDGVLLSPREFECLKWSAQGKSAWEIGIILGISRHTVATHLDNVKAKFGVRTIVQAVARFMTSKNASRRT